MSELLPCPFCGAPPVVIPSGERGAGTMIECLTTDCVNPHVSYYGDGEAAKRWNRRAAPASPEGLGDALEASQAEVARLREGLEPFAEMFRRARALLNTETKL